MLLWPSGKEGGAKHTGWLGEGSLQRAVYASAICFTMLMFTDEYLPYFTQKGASSNGEYAFVQHKSDRTSPEDVEHFQLCTLQLSGLATEWARKFWDTLREKASDSWIKDKLLGIPTFSHILPRHYCNIALLQDFQLD